MRLSGNHGLLFFEELCDWSHVEGIPDYLAIDCFVEKEKARLLPSLFSGLQVKFGQDTCNCARIL